MSEINASAEGLNRQVQSSFRSEQPERAENKRDSILPPNKQLQISYAVPVRGEISNGNFFLQVKDFTNQRGITSDMYEVIYARNNKPNDIVTGNQFYQENQKILSIIQYIQGVNTNTPKGLEKWQVKIIKAAKRKNLQIQTIDIPADLLSEDNVEDNMEHSRVYGENVVVDRFQTIQRNGTVVRMDADTRVGIDSTRLIKEQLVDQPTIEMLRIPYDEIPGEGGAKLFQTTSKERFKHTIVSLKNSLRDYKIDGWYAIKTASLGIHDPSQGSVFTSARLNTTQTTTKLASGIRLYTQDRARPEEIGGQFGQIRYEQLDEKTDKPHQLDHPALSLLLDLYEHNRGNKAMRAKTNEMLREYFSQEAWSDELGEKIMHGESMHSGSFFWDIREQQKVDPKNYADAIYRIVRKLSGSSETAFETQVLTEVSRERMRHNLIIAKVQRFLSKTYTLPAGNQFTVGDLQETPDRETLEAHFLKQNAWIIEALQHARTRHHTAEEAFASLQQEFPEYLKTFEDTEYTYSNALILGITRFIDEVKIHPDQFPDMASLVLRTNSH